MQSPKQEPLMTQPNKLLPKHSIPVDEEMLQSIIKYGASATIELDRSTVMMDLGTIEFLKTLRKNYVLNRLQMQLQSADAADVQEFYTNQKTLDVQVALLTYLIDINTFNQPTNEE